MKKSAQINIRLEKESRERIESILNRHPAMNMSGLLRECINKGLPLMEAEYLPPKSHPNREAQRAAA